MVVDSNGDSNFPHKLLLTNTRLSKTGKAFVNVSSSGIKFSNTQLCNMVELRGFLDRLLRPLLKTDLL